MSLNAGMFLLHPIHPRKQIFRTFNFHIQENMVAMAIGESRK